VGLLAIPVFGALVWGVWRLLFRRVVDASPTLRGTHPTGVPVLSPMPPGTESLIATGGTALPVALLVLVALAVGLSAVASVLPSLDSGTDDTQDGTA
jgi:hypothetical protein